MAASVTGREANFCPRAEGQRQSSGTETSPLTSALWGAFCPPAAASWLYPGGWQRGLELPLETTPPPGHRRGARCAEEGPVP